MGTAASIFDCAVNPLSPMAEDTKEGSGEDLVLEENVPLRSSLLWSMQRDFYDSKGINAWADGTVPNFVTSNSFIARSYARFILAVLKDVFQPSPAGASAASTSSGGVREPVYILELGAGHGKLGYLIVECLLRYRAFFPHTSHAFPFKYIISDAVFSLPAIWSQHPSLKEFVELGVIDFAHFDAEKDTQIKLIRSGVTLTPGNLSSPLIVISNYIFNTLTSDAFRIENGKLHQAKVTITAPEGCVDGGVYLDGSAATRPGEPAGIKPKRVNPAIISKMAAKWSYDEISAPSHVPVYNDKLMDGLLDTYLHSKSLNSAASLLMPVGAVRALRSLLDLSSGKLVMLVGDKAYTRLSEFEAHRDVHIATHGSFSIMVNMHALREITRAYGGQSLHTVYQEGFKTAAYFFGTPQSGASAPASFVFGSDSTAAGFDARKDELDLERGAPAASIVYPNAQWAFRDHVMGFSPEDFSTLQRNIKEECPTPSLKLLLALLRMSNHDSEVFYKFKQAIVDQITTAPADTTQKDARSDVDRIYASYFPLQTSKDLSFELGRVLMGLRDYSSGIQYFSKSNELCGEHHVTWYNIGICYYYMEDFETALDCFKRSLHLKSDYAEARVWWEKTASRIGYDVNDGVEGEEGEEGEEEEGEEGEEDRGAEGGEGDSDEDSEATPAQ